MALPLDGFRIVDLTRNVAGPYSTMMLADMGAEVIKVEPPSGDETRRLFRFPGRDEDAEDLFGMFNRNKRSIVVDLKTEQGKDLLRGLIARSDAFVQNSAPGAVDRLGFGYQAVSAINPKVVYTSISGFGPGDLRRAYDGVVQAATGVMELMGSADGPPEPAGLHVADLAASLFAAFATSNALHAVRHGGDGTYIDIAMADCLLALHSGAAAQYLATGTYPRGGAYANSTFRVPSDVYQAGDGRYVYLIANNSMWERFCEALDATELTGNPLFATNQLRVTNREALSEALGARAAKLTSAQICERMTQLNVPTAVVATLAEALDGRYARERAMVVEIGGELRAGRQPIRVMGIPYKFSNVAFGVRYGPPVLGEANDYVASDVLGSPARDAAGD